MSLFPFIALCVSAGFLVLDFLILGRIGKGLMSRHTSLYPPLGDLFASMVVIASNEISYRIAGVLLLLARLYLLGGLIAIFKKDFIKNEQSEDHVPIKHRD